MKLKEILCATSVTLAVVFAVSQRAAADPNDFEFELVESKFKQGDGATVAVKLVDKRTGKPVANAVVFATRLDMQPDGMETMTTAVQAIPSEQPGIYQFKTNLIMAGGWRFSLAAKVQGETGTVVSRLVLEVVE